MRVVRLSKKPFCDVQKIKFVSVTKYWRVKNETNFTSSCEISLQQLDLGKGPGGNHAFLDKNRDQDGLGSEILRYPAGHLPLFYLKDWIRHCVYDVKSPKEGLSFCDVYNL